MKLIGINQATGQLRWPIGSPYRLRLRITDVAGAVLPLVGRDLAMTIYRGASVLASVAGVLATDATGDYQEFAFGGSVFDGLGAPSQASWELAEVFSDGKTPMLAGTVLITTAAASAAGDGAYVLDSQFDEATWNPARDIMTVVLNGPVGPQGPAGNDALITRTAAEANRRHRGVRMDDSGSARLSDPATAQAVATMGISVGAANANALIDIRASGEMIEPSWTWAAGPVWLGPAGVLTQVVPDEWPAHSHGHRRRPHAPDGATAANRTTLTQGAD